MAAIPTLAPQKGHIATKRVDLQERGCCILFGCSQRIAPKEVIRGIARDWITNANAHFGGFGWGAHKGFLFPIQFRGRSLRKIGEISAENHRHRSPLNRKRPDVHKIVLSIKSPPPPRKSVNFEDFILIRAVFLILGPFGGGGKPNFCGQEFYGHPDFSD